MICKSHAIYCLHLLCSLLLSLCSCLHYCAARDTITAGNPINSTSNETLISDGKRFELRFLNISGHRYVGIQYYTWRPPEIVLVFNRDNPLPDSATGFFGILNGNLTLWDESGISYFSTSCGSSRSTAKLLDSGNLVVRDDQSGKNLLESFNNPTDTFLPGMNMNANLKLTSWTRPDDPTRGNFTFQQDEEVKNGYIVLKSGIVYWKSRETGSFNNYNNLYDPVAVLLNSSNSIQSNAGTILNSPNKTIIVPVRNNSNTVRNYNNTRLLMNSYGQVQYFIWRDSETGSSGWSLIWSQPRDQCSVYNACGNFGSCNVHDNNRWLCKCLPGFEPASQDRWDSEDFSGGCTRKSDICGRDKDMFLNLTMMKVGKPDTPLSEVQNETECRTECLDNCQCLAYSYEASRTRRDGTRHGCWIWTSVPNNLQEEYATDPRNIAVRVVASSIGSTNKSCKTCGTNIIPYPLSTGPNCGDPMYFNFSCNYSTGQVSFQTLGGTFQVININPETRKFVIEVKAKDRCGAKNSKPKYLQLSPSSPFNAPDSCHGGMQSGNGNDVEFDWNSPPEPLCTSTIDCMDWPNSSCNATRDVKGRCHCNANYQWNGTTLACTQVRSGGSGQSGSSDLKTGVILLVVLFMFVLLCIISLIFYRRRMAARRRESRERKERSQALRMYDMERNVKNLIYSSEFKEDDKKGIGVPVFDLESILEATNYFSDENKLGEGGFGPVYKGKFPGGQEIAIKRLSSHSGQGLEEFKNEVVLIAKLQHRNLVRLLGYCIKGDEKILLYEYMPNKSLDTFIFDRTLCLSLDWEKRFGIILGVARGLLYLHQDSRLRIIHRDLKTSNILLDEEMNPKISDFGLARIVKGKETEANTKRIVGTYGYMSPEYALDGLFSVKSDVFSFGVIVLEIVSGKRNTGFYQSKEALNLLGYAWRLWNEEKALDLMDRTLVESCNRGEVLKCINVGFLCVQEDPSDRPNVSSVLSILTSEAATPLPNPKKPAFVAKKWISSRPSSSFDKPETSYSNNELTISTEPGR
ncbi:G-type lectin S-receptor-like serine/threonine-protein kinase At4g03230 [Camellia sinensis]|uniref:G-type lectin S-receptor-like serine/threonine-protein kinase At4g03230 n=1 Tax=Camellia sinensis TaxID=4442 RepID=UPI00103679E1|nr:G-type lectin S-receptor-like serine/threonine-protein kinase At4g03230 [Camellia sinensis]